MAVLTAFLVFIPLLMIQVGIIANLPLIQGYPDLIMLAIVAWSSQPAVRTAWQWAMIGGLLMTLVSAMPVGVYLLAYTMSVGMVLLLRRLVWRIPFLTVLVMTILGTFLSYSLSHFALQLLGRSLPFGFTFGAIFIPSVLYNILFTIPIYAFIVELAKWIHPVELLYEP